MKPDKQASRRAAQRLIESFSIKAIPVPVERIARSLKIRVQYAPLDGDLSGMSSIQGDIPVIGINSLHHPHRQRFTLAHELGHIELHRSILEGSVHVDKQILNRDAITETGADRLEIEANAFASELLMPDDLVELATSGKTVDFEDDEAILILSNKFKVSVAAMRFRLFAPR